MDDSVTQAVATGALGILGRCLALAHGKRSPFGWSLLWELPVAIGMGIIGEGLAEYVGATGYVAHAVTISVAYVGPRFIDLAVSRFAA